MSKRNDDNPSPSTASSADPPQALSPRTADWLAAAAIVVVVFVAYMPCMNGGFVWDDNRYVEDNPKLRDLAGLREAWFDPMKDYRHQYYPITVTGFWVQYQLWGLNVTGYHVTNVLLHAACAILLWLGLRRLRVPGALIAGVIFGMHPVHVDSVAWIAELKNTLSMFFWLLAIHGYIRFARLGEESDDAPSSEPSALPVDWRWYGAALGAFVLALLAKSATGSLPIVLLLMLWWQRPRLSLKRDVLPLVPLTALAAGMMTVTASLEGSKTKAGAVDIGLGALERLLTGTSAVWFYLYKLLLPVNLSSIYPKWDVSAGSVVWWLGLGGVVAAGAALFVVCRKLPTRTARGIVAATAFYLLTIAPLYAVNVGFMVHSLVANHWTYWASTGVFALAGAGLSIVAHRLAKSPAEPSPQRPARFSRPTVICAAIIALLYLPLTWQRAGVYAGPIELWTDTLDRNPASETAAQNLGVAYNNRGLTYFEDADYDRAFDDFRKAVEAYDAYERSQFNLAQLLHMSGDLKAALKRYDRALELKPDFALAWSQSGLLLAQTGRVAEARERYEQAVALGLDDPAVLQNLAMTQQETGDRDAAIITWRKLLARQPNNPVALRAMEQLHQPEPTPVPDSQSDTPPAREAHPSADGNATYD